MSDLPPPSAHVLAVSLDAADAEHVLAYARAGELPALRRLMDEGATVDLASIADRFPDAVFSTIATGCLPGVHGHYNWRCLRPGTYAMTIAPVRSYRQPFWQVMHRTTGCRLLLFDVQQAPLLREEGVTQVAGWGQRAARIRASWPPELYEEVAARHPPAPRWLDDDVVRRSARRERRYLQEVERHGRARADAVCELLRDRPWEFAFVSFHEAHNAGHVVHRHLEPGTWAYDERRAARFGSALGDVYRLADDGLRRILESVPGDTDVLVFAGQGFRLNTNGLQLLPRVLTGLGYQVPAAAPALLPRLLNAAAARVPWSVRRVVNDRLPEETRRRALERMWAEAVDWERTRAVAETAFGTSWVRINLRGREPGGTVSPGREYDDLCEEIAGELRALTLEGTGEPAVANVERMNRVLAGPHVGEMPDLRIDWVPDRLVGAVRHPRLGVVRESMNDLTTAEHSARGFLVAAGPRIRRTALVEGRIVDVAPTLLYLMGAPIPEDMDGDVLAAVVDPSMLAARPPRREPLAWADDPWAP